MLVVKLLIRFLFGVFLDKSEYEFTSKKFNPVKSTAVAILLALGFMSPYMIYKSVKIYERVKVICPSAVKQL